jgi:hypothetical protein
MTASALEEGYWRAYKDFYRWGSIWRGASAQSTLRAQLRHLAYSGGWKKFEPLWDFAIRTGQVLHALPLLESVLSAFGERPARADPPWLGRHASTGGPADVTTLPREPLLQISDRCTSNHRAPAPRLSRRRVGPFSEGDAS